MYIKSIDMLMAITIFEFDILGFGPRSGVAKHQDHFKNKYIKC